MYRPNLSVVCFFICLSYFIFDCALLLFCAQAWRGKTLSSWNDPIFFCSLHWRNLSLYNKITTTHFKQIRFWWKNVIKFRGKVYSNFFKFVQQLFFLSVVWKQHRWQPQGSAKGRANCPPHCWRWASLPPGYLHQAVYKESPEDYQRLQPPVPQTALSVALRATFPQHPIPQ